MKIFVTGSAGLIGSWLVERLLREGHIVTSIDNLIGGYLDNIIKHKNHTFIKGNICDFELINTSIANHDVVFHTAALAYEGLSVFSPAAITNNIVTGTITIASAAVNNAIKRFINCSSMARYGINEIPYTEDMIPKPVDPYGNAKLFAEQQINMLANIHGLDVIHVIPHNIIGPRQRYNDPFRNVAAIMINLMLQGRQPIIYGSGNQKRCFSFIQDDVDILYQLINYDLIKNCDIFNIGPDDEFITINELAIKIAELLNFDLKIQYYDERPCEVKLANCSADKIRRVFNYETKYSLHDGLQLMIDYIKNRGTLDFEYHIDIEIMKNNIPKVWSDKIF